MGQHNKCIDSIDYDDYYDVTNELTKQPISKVYIMLKQPLLNKKFIVNTWIMTMTFMIIFYKDNPDSCHQRPIVNYTVTNQAGTQSDECPLYIVSSPDKNSICSITRFFPHIPGSCQHFMLFPYTQVQCGLWHTPEFHALSERAENALSFIVTYDKPGILHY